MARDPTVTLETDVIPIQVIANVILFKQTGDEDDRH